MIYGAKIGCFFCLLMAGAFSAERRWLMFTFLLVTASLLSGLHDCLLTRKVRRAGQ